MISVAQESLDSFLSSNMDNLNLSMKVKHRFKILTRTCKETSLLDTLREIEKVRRFRLQSTPSILNFLAGSAKIIYLSREIN